jgi:hypothetical protein
MAVSKLDVAVVAVMAVALLRLEHGHRIVIGTPAPAEAAPQAAAVCPATDDVPFSADCIKFIDGGTWPDRQARLNVLVVTSDARGRAASLGPACPASNENAPYSANCIKFLSGAYWQATPTEAAR